MVINNPTARQLSLEFSSGNAAEKMPAQTQAQMPSQSQKSNPALLKMETGEFLLLKLNSAFNSLLVLLEKARPEGGKYFRTELCRIFCARIEGEKAILDKFPPQSRMREAQSLLHGLEYFPGGFRKNMKNDDWKWRAVSEEEQNIRYALERYSAMCMLSGLHSLFQEREYRDFIMVLGLYERNAIEAARKPRERGQPRVSGYEVLVCSDIQCAVSGKVEQLAKNKENSQ